MQSPTIDPRCIRSSDGPDLFWWVSAFRVEGRECFVAELSEGVADRAPMRASSPCGVNVHTEAARAHSDGLRAGAHVEGPSYGQPEGLPDDGRLRLQGQRNMGLRECNKFVPHRLSPDEEWRGVNGETLRRGCTMVATNVPSEMTGTRRVSPVVSLASGVLLGLLAYYVTAVVASAQIPGNFTISPLTLVMIAAVSALAVAGGWRWPVVGLTSGIIVLLVIAWAVGGRMAWSSSSSDWLSPFNAVAFGAASGYPTMVGAVLVTASALSLRPRRAR